MNREKRLNKSDRKKRTCLNDSVCQNLDDDHAASLAREHCRLRQLRDRTVYDGYSLGRLNSDQLKAEVDSFRYSDLLTFCNREADGCASESYQRRVVDNNDDYQQCLELSNRNRKKKKNCGLGYVHTISPSTAVLMNTEDDAAGLVNRHMRSIGHTSEWQDHTVVQQSQPITFQNEAFSSDDHFLSASTVTATVAATEKVFCQKHIQ